MMLENSEISDFCQKLPKIELHAHLNGSLSNQTLKQLAEERMKFEHSSSFYQIESKNSGDFNYFILIELKGVPVPNIDLDNLTIDEVFHAFKHIQGRKA